VYKGYYSVTDECFYTAEQVEMKGGRHYSLETGSEAELSEEENYILPLSKLAGPLDDHYQTSGRDCVFPKEYATSVVSEIRNGLQDLSVSRPSSRLQWGIPVPNDPDHTIYVWVDALINYLTATGYPWKRGGVDDKSNFWPPDVQVIGKDIVR
jgi:methionyl-tRNA synthetase